MRRFKIKYFSSALVLLMLTACTDRLPSISTTPTLSPPPTISAIPSPSTTITPDLITSPAITSIPSAYPSFTLVTGGYGYQVGDIVLMDTQKEIELGDIVQYDWNLNKSNSGAMGAGKYLVKIIGKPGDKVSFGIYSYKANGYLGSFDNTHNRWPDPNPSLWGTTKYEDILIKELIVPDDEYLADKWIGYESIPGEFDESGTSSKRRSRFTIKRQAIKGVVLNKVGHDYEFEEKQKHIQY